MYRYWQVSVLMNRNHGPCNICFRNTTVEVNTETIKDMRKESISLDQFNGDCRIKRRNIDIFYRYYVCNGQSVIRNLRK